MTPEHEAGLIQEIAGMRFVLIHWLARMGDHERKAISEAINEEFMPIESLTGERAWVPYRAAVDDLLAAATLRANQTK